MSLVSSIYKLAKTNNPRSIHQRSREKYQRIKHNQKPSLEWRVFRLNCNEAGIKAYDAYLKTDWWIARRQQKIESAGGKCKLCGSTEKLQVHHWNYSRLFKEKNKDLIVLCRDCHGAVHAVGASAPRKSLNHTKQGALHSSQPGIL